MKVKETKGKENEAKTKNTTSTSQNGRAPKYIMSGWALMTIIM